MPDVTVEHKTTLAYSNTLRKRKEIGGYWLGRTLGKGASGRVKLGYHKRTGDKVAVKIIAKAYLTSSASTERSVKREIAIMKLIQHPHILKLIDVIDLPESSNLYLILEYVQGGELFEYLIQQGRLSEVEARTYFRQIIFGVDFCHRHLICHRDLKPENLLLDSECNIKIADFGMASLQPSGAFLETSCGSPHYASPEVVTGIRYNGIASDIWSCGVILYALLCGHLPFDDNDIRELLKKVKAGKYDLPSHLSSTARDFIQHILVVDPKKRMTMEQLQQHVWFNGPSMSKQPALPDMPARDALAKLIIHEDDIDARLLETMQALWVDRGRADLVGALMDNKYNMEKVTYMLLMRHAQQFSKEGHAPPARKPRPMTICGWDTLKMDISAANGFKDALSVSNTPDPSKRAIAHRSLVVDAAMENAESSRQHDANFSQQLMRTSFILHQQQRIEEQQRQQRQYMQDDTSIKMPSSTTPPLPPPVPPKPAVIMDSAAAAMLNAPVPPPPAMRFLYRQHHRVEPLTGSISAASPSSPSPSPSRRTSTTTPVVFLPITRNDEPICSIDQLLLKYQQQHRDQQQQQQGHSQNHAPLVPPPRPQISRQSTNSRNHAKPKHPLMHQNASFLTSQPRVAPTARATAPIDEDARASSWLPSLFNFKRPKVYTLSCSAKDEKEALGKISQVIRQRLNGYYVEHLDHDGQVQRHAQITLALPQQDVSMVSLMRREPEEAVHHMRFKLEPEQRSTLSLLLSPGRYSSRTMRFSLTYLKGDSQYFVAAMRALERTLNDYEQDARIIAGINGWMNHHR